MGTELVGKAFPQGAVINLRAIEKNKEFKLGDELILQKVEMKEIALCVKMIGMRLLESSQNFARADGLLSEVAET